MEKVKLIVIGDAGKISSNLMNVLRKQYKCEIELVSADEYKKLKDFSDLSQERSEQADKIYVLQNPKVSQNDFEVPPIEEPHFFAEKKKTTKLYTPKKTGKVNSKEMSTVRKYNQKRLRTR